MRDWYHLGSHTLSLLSDPCYPHLNSLSCQLFILVSLVCLTMYSRASFWCKQKHQKNYAPILRTNLQDTVISVPVWRRRGLSSWGVNADKETVLYEGLPLRRFPPRSHPTREPETRRQVSHHELALVRVEGFYDLFIYIYFFSLNLQPVGGTFANG